MSTTTRWLRTLWRIWSSMRLAAILLLALLLASLVLSLFPHMPDDPVTRESWLAAARLRYGPAVGLWQALGLFAGHRSPLFLALFAALLLNTAACTVRRFVALCRSLTRAPVVIQSPAFYEQAVVAARWPAPLKEDVLERVRQSLARHGYRVCVSPAAHDTHLYAERGKWGQLGSPVSHVAAIAFFLALLAGPALRWQTSNDPTFWPAIGALSVFLVATLASLWVPHRRLWLHIDEQGARMVGRGDFGSTFDRLVEKLSGTCGEVRMGGDG